MPLFLEQCMWILGLLGMIYIVSVGVDGWLADRRWSKLEKTWTENDELRRRQAEKEHEDAKYDDY